MAQRARTRRRRRRLASPQTTKSSAHLYPLGRVLPSDTIPRYNPPIQHNFLCSLWSSNSGRKVREQRAPKGLLDAIAPCHLRQRSAILQISDSRSLQRTATLLTCRQSPTRPIIVHSAEGGIWETHLGTAMRSLRPPTASGTWQRLVVISWRM